MKLFTLFWSATTLRTQTVYSVGKHRTTLYSRNNQPLSTTRTMSALFSTTATTSGDSVTDNINKDIVHRILCYGDSLTAGTTDSLYELYPYAPHLEKALNDLVVETTTRSSSCRYVVRHRGMPGWTASTMVEATDDPQCGLRAAIQAVSGNAPPLPPLACVIILAGTNDLG